MASMKCPICRSRMNFWQGNHLICVVCDQLLAVRGSKNMPITKEVYCEECNQKMVSERLVIGKKSFLIYKCSNGHVKSLDKGYGEIFGQIGDDTYELSLNHSPKNDVGTFKFSVNGKVQEGITKIILTITRTETLMSVERRLDG